MGYTFQHLKLFNIKKFLVKFLDAGTDANPLASTRSTQSETDLNWVQGSQLQEFARWMVRLKIV